MTHVLFAVAAAALVASCGSSPSPEPRPAAKPCSAVRPTLAIAASERVNATAAGAGRPVQVRVYLLKGDARLRNASFEEIWQNDAEILQGDLIQVDQHTLFPGKSQQVRLAPKGEARHVAVVALFGEPQGKDWFVSYELLPPRTRPPCPREAPKLAVWLDRMQIQDGDGRAEEPAPEEPPGTDASSTGGTRD